MGAAVPYALAQAVGAMIGPAGFGSVPMGIVIAQSDLETGGWSSRLYREANNAFGMRYARQRDTPAIGETAQGFAIYATVADSVADYFDRQRAFDIPNTPNASAYAAATVQSGYAEEAGYFDAWLSRYRPAAVPAASGAAGLLFLAIILIFAIDD
jgi:hypothetical protein